MEIEEVFLHFPTHSHSSGFVPIQLHQGHRCFQARQPQTAEGRLVPSAASLPVTVLRAATSPSASLTPRVLTSEPRCLAGTVTNSAQFYEMFSSQHWPETCCGGGAEASSVTFTFWPERKPPTPSVCDYTFPNDALPQAPLMQHHSPSQRAVLDNCSLTSIILRILWAACQLWKPFSTPEKRTAH